MQGPNPEAQSHHRDDVTSFLDPLISFVSAHAWLAYLTLFLAALLEAVPAVGSVIPGSAGLLALSGVVPGGAGGGVRHPRLDYRPGAERPGRRRRAQAAMGVAGGGARRSARRWFGL